MTIDWRRVAGAAGYRVSIRLQDGRRLDRTQRRPGLVLRRVARRTRGTVRVSAVSVAGLSGRARAVRLRAR